MRKPHVSGRVMFFLFWFWSYFFLGSSFSYCVSFSVYHLLSYDFVIELDAEFTLDFGNQNYYQHKISTGKGVVSIIPFSFSEQHSFDKLWGTHLFCQILSVMSYNWLFYVLQCKIYLHVGLYFFRGLFC